MKKQINNMHIPITTERCTETFRLANILLRHMVRMQIEMTNRQTQSLIQPFKVNVNKEESQTTIISYIPPII